MIEAGVVVNTVPFEMAMQRLKKGVRDGFIDPQYGTLTVQGRLLAERCQAMTPPRNYSQGRKRVEKDISRAFQPLRPQDFRSPSIQRIIRKDDRDGWREAAKHFSSRNLRNTEAISFDPAHHAKQRKSRGRVFNSGGVVTLGPQATRVRRYIRTKQALVGWAKAGWNIAIMALGGRVKDAWVSKHSVARGRIIDARAAPDPYIRVINDTSWGKGGQTAEKVVRDAIGYRARDMMRYFETQMKLARDKAMAGLRRAA